MAVSCRLPDVDMFRVRVGQLEQLQAQTLHMIQSHEVIKMNPSVCFLLCLMGVMSGLNVSRRVKIDKFTYLCFYPSARKNSYRFYVPSFSLYVNKTSRLKILQ